MTMLARAKRVTFRRTFALRGLEGLQPSGTYSVETHTEHAGLFSFLNTKQTSTWIRICRRSGIGGVLQLMRICPHDLRAALTQDAMPDGK